MFSFALLPRISRTRLRPSFSTAAPALPALQHSNAPSLASNAVQSASVNSDLSPSNGFTALACNAATAAACAGLIAPLSGSGFAGGDLGEREAGDFRGGDAHVLGGDGEIFLLLAIEQRDGARIEGREPAATEVIIHLGLDRPHGGGGGGGGVAGGQDVGRVGSAFFFQSSNAAHSAKNASVLA